MHWCLGAVIYQDFCHGSNIVIVLCTDVFFFPSFDSKTSLSATHIWWFCFLFLGENRDSFMHWVFFPLALLEKKSLNAKKAMMILLLLKQNHVEESIYWEDFAWLWFLRFLFVIAILSHQQRRKHSVPHSGFTNQI